MKGLASRGAQRGQSTVEYTIVVIAVVVILIARPDVITELVDAIRQIYSAFVSTISASDVIVEV